MATTGRSVARASAPRQLSDIRASVRRNNGDMCQLCRNTLSTVSRARRLGAMPEVSSIVLVSAEPDRTISFYRSVGINFGDEDHDEGSVHSATNLGDIHVAVFPASGDGKAPPRRAAGSTFVGFYVDSLDEKFSALSATGAHLLLDHEVQEWGCRIVVEDPDGRPVEINQGAHRAGSSPD